MKLNQTTVIAATILVTGLIVLLQILPAPPPPGPTPINFSTPAAVTAPKPQSANSKSVTSGIKLPIPRGELVNKLVAAGVIDPRKIELEKLTDLHLLWAFGLANKNPILETGPMTDPRYGGSGPPAGGFASTGGWTLAKGDPMAHYSQHQFITLTDEQQALIEKLAKNIYRPCCDNATYFPDCNHGMAMLGLLEIFAAGGASEEEMWAAALTANRLWFPDAYAAIDEYLKTTDREPASVAPAEILGAAYSSASGYQRVLSQITPPAGGGGSSCAI